MPPPQTELTAVGVERSTASETDAAAFGRVARSQLKTTPLAVCFPRDDDRFAQRVQSLLDGSQSDGPLAAAVQALLRETYPLAVVTPRHELAALDGGHVWYAFRDGSAVPNMDRGTS